MLGLCYLNVWENMYRISLLFHASLKEKVTKLPSWVAVNGRRDSSFFCCSVTQCSPLPLRQIKSLVLLGNAPSKMTGWGRSQMSLVWFKERDGRECVNVTYHCGGPSQLTPLVGPSHWGDLPGLTLPGLSLPPRTQRLHQAPCPSPLHST